MVFSMILNTSRVADNGCLLSFKDLLQNKVGFGLNKDGMREKKDTSTLGKGSGNKNDRKECRLQIAAVNYVTNQVFKRQNIFSCEICVLTSMSHKGGHFP